MKKNIRIMNKTLTSIFLAATMLSAASAAHAATPAGAAFSLNAPAQTIVTGSIRDAATHEGEPAAVIQFFRADNLEKPVAYTITDENGNFSHAIDAQGEYVMVFSGVGRKEMRRTFTLNGQEKVELGSMDIEDDVQMLEAGRVVALKDIIKMDVDRITYKISDDVDAKTSTLLDMLRKVPMVTVDAQDKITVNGSSSFQVLVDGKPNMMMSSNPSQVFKALPASFAKDIQVITNPGVKYDAEGVGGVLNITTNKEFGASSADLDGYNATISLGAGTTGVSGSGFVTIQKGKFSASANVSATEANIPGVSSETVRLQLDEKGDAISKLTSISEGGLKAPVKLVSGNLGYEINEENLISATIGYNAIASHNTATNNVTFAMADMGETAYKSTTSNVWDVTSVSGGIDWQRSFKDNADKLFTLSYQFSSSPSVTDSKSIFEGAGATGMVNRYTDGSTNTLQNTIQADYTTRLFPTITFNAGAKYINRLNKSDQALFLDNAGTWEQDRTGSMIYRHNNDIVAGYAEATYSKGAFSGKGGVRYEHTFQNVIYKLGNGTDFKMNYGNLVPAASIQYNIGMLQNIGLNYNMRISRPGITYLNPYVDISDPSALTYGNSELETEKAHNISLVYNFLSPIVIANINLAHSYTGNGIEAYSFFDENGLLNMTYGNIARRNTTGLNAMLMFNIGTTRLIVNSGTSYNDLRSSARGLHNSGWSSNALASLQTTLPFDIRFSSNVIWTSRTQSLDGSTTGITMITGGLNKSFLDNKVQLGLSAVGPANFKRDLVTTSISEGADYRQTSISRVPISIVTGSLTFNFGSSKSATVKKTRKTISNDDLMDRSNSSQASSAISL